MSAQRHRRGLAARVRRHRRHRRLARSPSPSSSSSSSRSWSATRSTVPVDVVRVILGQTVPGASFTVGELRLPRATLALSRASRSASRASRSRPCCATRSPRPTSSASARVRAPPRCSASSCSRSTSRRSRSSRSAGRSSPPSRSTCSPTGAASPAPGSSSSASASRRCSTASSRMCCRRPADVGPRRRRCSGSPAASTARPGRSSLPLAVACVVLVPLLLVAGAGASTCCGSATTLRRASASTSGARRIVLIVAAVALLAFATAATGPIAFVAFMAGPIAARVVRPGGSLLLPAGLIGALLVLGRRPRRAVRLRHPLPGRRHHRRARRAVPHLPPHQDQPLRRLAMTQPHTLAAQSLDAGLRRPDDRRRAWTSRSRPGASPPSSARTAAASRRCCALSRAS